MSSTKRKPAAWFPGPAEAPPEPVPALGEQGPQQPRGRGRPKKHGVQGIDAMQREHIALEVYQRARLSGKTHVTAVRAASTAVARSCTWVKNALSCWHGTGRREVWRVEVGAPLPPPPGVVMGPTYHLSVGPRPEYENHRERRAADDFKARQKEL